MRARPLSLGFLILFTAAIAIGAAAQSLVSGDITGVVSDPSGAVIPNATVTLKSNGTGQTNNATTNPSGVYRFSLLTPGQYTVTVNASGFQNAERTVTVTVGQATSLNLQLAVGSSSQTVEVTGEGGVVQSENGNISTTFTAEQVQLVPNPGNDLSYIVQSAPGAVMNTQAGYGNSATFGLPATSNLFTVNGMNENDPFLNLNNSGATNLLLGQERRSGSLGGEQRLFGTVRRPCRRERKLCEQVRHEQLARERQLFLERPCDERQQLVHEAGATFKRLAQPSYVQQCQSVVCFRGWTHHSQQDIFLC
jgi:hypothetical protein